MTKIRVVGMEEAPKGPLGSRDFYHCDPSLNAYFCSYTLFILGADFFKGILFKSYRTAQEIPNPRVIQ